MGCACNFLFESKCTRSTLRPKLALKRSTPSGRSGDLHIVLLSQSNSAKFKQPLIPIGVLICLLESTVCAIVHMGWEWTLVLIGMDTENQVRTSLVLTSPQHAISV